MILSQLEQICRKNYTGDYKASKRVCMIGRGLSKGNCARNSSKSLKLPKPVVLFPYCGTITHRVVCQASIDAKLTSLHQLHNIFRSLADLSSLITMGKEEGLKQADDKFHDFTSLITGRLGSMAEEIKDEVQMALCDLSRQFEDHQDITEARFKDILRLYGQRSNKRRSRQTWSPDQIVRL